MLLSVINFWLGNDRYIEDNSHILEILYYWDIFKVIRHPLSYFTLQAALNCKSPSINGWEVSVNIKCEEHVQWVVEYKRSTPSCGDDFTCYLCIQHDSPDQFCNQSACKTSGSHDLWCLTRYCPDTFYAELHSQFADDMTPEKCIIHSWSMVKCSRICAVSTLVSWHNWSQLDMEQCQKMQRCCHYLLTVWLSDYPKSVMVAQAWSVKYHHVWNSRWCTNRDVKHSTTWDLKWSSYLLPASAESLFE